MADGVIPVDLITLKKRLFASFGNDSDPVFPVDALKLSLPDLLRSSDDGLAHVPSEVLKKCVRPVVEGLRSIDAVSLLELDRACEGAVVDKGLVVRPIHTQIKPACADDTVRYLHLSDLAGQYSMGIFVFPPHSKIPLHDHPGMCVLSRVLYGSLERTSLDLVRDDESDSSIEDKSENLDTPWRMSWRITKTEGKKFSEATHSRKNLPEGTRRALKNHVDHLAAPDCTVLYPYEGNLHEFVAGPDGAAVLDVLFPPYDDHDRDCTFYNIVERPAEKADDSGRTPCWIVPTGQPEGFHCVSGQYRTLGD